MSPRVRIPEEICAVHGERSDTTTSRLIRGIVGVRCATSATTIAEQRTGTSDVVRAGSEEHDDDDVAMDGRCG